MRQKPKKKTEIRSAHRWIWILSALAGIRVFVFAAGFPLFNNVDEHAHVDLVLKYSEGEQPRTLAPISRETAYYYALYGSPEYFDKPAAYPPSEFPEPIWRQPDRKIAERLEAVLVAWKDWANYEAGEPPLYYLLAASVWKLGSLLGMRPGLLLYYVRFLDVAVVAALVWVGYRAARLAFPENNFPRIAVPVLVAFFPQDTFYSIESDVLSPLFFGIAFIGLLQLFRSDHPTIFTAVYTGLALSAACLSKTTNVPMLLVAAIAVGIKARQLVRSGEFGRHGRALTILSACAILPIAAWMAWNYRTFGDVTGAAGKLEYWGWTRKPLSEWWSHPIFTPSGFYKFWRELIGSFWHGEVYWHGQQLSRPLANSFYWISSTVVLAIVATTLWRQQVAKPERYALWLSVSCFIMAVAFVAGLSLAFDFHDAPYPSRAEPYFTSGRLLAGAMIPFLLIYAYALERIGAWARRKSVSFILLGIIVAGITISELTLRGPVLASRYNFFHMF
jgi:hypothetical protein